MKDLGVTFDSKFTLNQHIEGLLINFFKGETHVPDHQENYVYVFTANTRILLLNMVSNKNSPRQTTWTTNAICHPRASTLTLPERS